MGTDHKIGKRSLTGSGEGTASLPRNDTVDFSRREIFSLYHRGIQIDKEDWNDVTPECVARHVAKKLQGKFIIDALSGYGGNTIQFAKYSPCVIGIEIDPHKLKNAKHNAEIYGVGDAIEFVNADFFSMKKLKADVVFLAPSELPVEKNQKFSLEHHLSPSLPQLIRHSLKLASSLVISLPPNTCIDELAAVFSDIYQENPDGYASLNYTLQIDLLSIDESLISMVVYFGGNNQISTKEQKDLVYETISMSELRSSQESLSENAIHHLIESVGLHRSLNMISNIEESLATQKRNDEGIISIFLTQLIQQNLLSNEILAQWQKEPESPMLSSTKSSKSGQSLGLALMATEKTPSLHDPPILLSTPSIKQLSKILSIQNSLKTALKS